MYWQTFKESWQKLWKNPSLLLPDFLYITIFTLLGYTLLRYYGMVDIYRINGIKSFISILSNYNLLPGLIASIASFVIVTFFLGSSLLSWKYSMIKNRINGKNNGLICDFRDGHKKIMSVIFIKMIVFSISVVALFLGILLIAFGKFNGNYTAGLVIVSIIEIIFFIFYIAGIFFRYPMMFSSNLNAVDSFKESFRFVMKRYDIVIVTMVVTLTTGFLVVASFNFVLSMIFVSNKTLPIIFGIILGVWKDIFLFDIYRQVRKK